MSRAVIPSQRGSELRSRDPGVTANADEGDKFPEKLIKYVPAEVLAFFVPIAAALGSERDGLLVAVFVVAAIGTPGYLWLTARSLPQEKQPLWHFYVLAVIAFVGWSLATTRNVAALVGLDEIAAGVVLALAVFLIPLADGVLGRVLPRAK